MKYIPRCPSVGGAKLAAYLAADPHRRAIYNEIRARLDPAGGIGSDARYWICQRPQRRAVLRGILLCLGERLPLWSKDSALAKVKNQAFIESYRDAYRQSQIDAQSIAGANSDGD